MVAAEGNVTVGQPLVQNAKVIATIAEQGRAKKGDYLQKETKRKVIA